MSEEAPTSPSEKEINPVEEAAPDHPSNQAEEDGGEQADQSSMDDTQLIEEEFLSMEEDGSPPPNERPVRTHQCLCRA